MNQLYSPSSDRPRHTDPRADVRVTGRTHSRCAWFVLLWLLLAAATAAHATSNNIDWQVLGSAPYALDSEYWRADSETADLDAAREAYQQGRFAPTPQGVSLGFTDAVYWFHFRLRYYALPDSQPIAGPLETYLSFDYPHLDAFTVHHQTAQGVWKQTQLGDELPFIQRPLATTGFVLPLRYRPDSEDSFWVKVKTTSSLQMPISLWHKDRFVEHVGHVRLAYGVYLGILAVMAIYNLFLGFSTRDVSYFHYVGYIVCFVVLQATLLGYTHQYWWPGLQHWNRTAIPLLTLFSLGFALLFSRYYLNTPRTNPKLDTLMVGLALLMFLLGLVCGWLPYKDIINTSIWFSLVVALLLFYVGTLNLLRGYVQARLFVLAWGILLAGSVIYGFAMKGVLPLNRYTQHAAQIGSALEVILLSLALADRINRITREKQALERSAKVAMEIKNRELQSALAKVNESNALKDAFLATISHELRTPMNGIEGALQVIEDATRDKGLLYNVQTARFSAHHMTHLVESLLEFSELQSGKLKLDERPFQLQPLLAPLLRHIAMRCAKKNIAFQVYGLALPYGLHGDGERLSHVLFQLLDNAVKFTHQGELRLSLQAHETDADGEGHDVVTDIELQDSGIGMAADTLQRLFETFRQADSSFSRQYGGLGIGLALTRALVLKMGGTLDISSVAGQGTTVRLRLPWKKVALVPEAPAPDQPQSSEQSAVLPVLIVEDNPVNQMTLRAMVRKLGFTAETANNGEEAVALCQQNRFGCVLMDCQMPIMDGFEATRRIRALDNGNARVPIVAVTANAMSQDRDNCLAAGMDDYLKKPVTKAQVQASLQTWLVGPTEHSGAA